MNSNSLIYNNLKQKYAGKKILVVGLGLLGGGVGIAKFFAELGAKVTVTDKKTKQQLTQSINELSRYPIKYYLGSHPEEIFLDADVIFKGPFVPWDLPQLVTAEKKGIPIEMELSFFTEYCPAKIIGITGTRGKSTTTMMIYQILKDSGLPVHLGGSLPNISTINLLKQIKPTDWVVLELSSWALSDFHRKKLSPHIAVFTNFYPDHLNYYKTIDDYFYDKTAIFCYQQPGDFLVANQSLKSKIDKLSSSIIFFKKEDFSNQFTQLKGGHNQENAAAAVTVAKILKLDSRHYINKLKYFHGLPFRQQIVGKKGNIVFVNDTTSTTPVATITALDAFAGKNIILIMGGNSKNLPTHDLVNYLTKPKKIVLLAGSLTNEIMPILKQKYPEKITEVYDNLEKAVEKAYQLAKELMEEVYILFSPAATSFAMFNNEFHRGEEFNRIVSRLL